MYYLIDNDPDIRCDTIDDVLEYCVNEDYWLDDRDGFDEHMDYDGQIEVGGYEYYPSRILREMGDYDDAIADWARDQMECEWDNFRYKVSRLRDGQNTWVCNYEVYAYEEDEEEEPEEVDEEVIETIETRVEITFKEEQAVHEENKRLEDEFMSVFQTLS